jgi:hypothetical protein
LRSPVTTRPRNGLLDHLASVGRWAGLLIRMRSANAALFLASDNSLFVIGAELFDDGSSKPTPRTTAVRRKRT